MSSVKGLILEPQEINLSHNARHPTRINPIQMSGGLNRWLDDVASIKGLDDSASPKQSEKDRTLDYPIEKSPQKSAGLYDLRPFPPNSRKYRPSALIPFVLSATAWIISLLLVVAGTKPGLMSNINMLSFNATGLGTDVIHLAPASNSSTTSQSSSSAAGTKREAQLLQISTNFETITTSATIYNSPPSSTQMARRQLLSLLDPLGLVPALVSAGVAVGTAIIPVATTQATIVTTTPAPIATPTSTIVPSSVAASTPPAQSSSSQIASTPLPSSTVSSTTQESAPAPSTRSNGTTTSTGVTALSMVVSQLANLGLMPILTAVLPGLGPGGFTQPVDDGINTAIAEVRTNLTTNANVSGFIGVYILTTCKGSSVSNVTSCDSFSAASDKIGNISHSFPSSIVLAGTNFSSPALQAMTDSISSFGPFINAFDKFFLIFMILSLTNSTSAIILSLLGVFFPQNRKILYSNLSLATFGFLSRVTDALLSTFVAGALTFMTNKFGKPIGVTAKIGSTFIGLIWLGLACQFLASSYWARIWFVEFRQRSYRIREREAHEVGNYRNIRAEFRSDRKFPKEEKDLEKSLKAV